MLAADDLEQFNRHAAKARSLGRDAIPVFLEVLDKSLEKPARLLNYGKTGVCLMHLHELAKAGIYSKEEIPVLLKALRNQLAIADTLVTADLLKIITGLDVGYNEQFVATYTSDSEPDRRAMIDIWEQWYRANK